MRVNLIHINTLTRTQFVGMSYGGPMARRFNAKAQRDNCACEGSVQ